MQKRKPEEVKCSLNKGENCNKIGGKVVFINYCTFVIGFQ